MLFLTLFSYVITYALIYKYHLISLEHAESEYMILNSLNIVALEFKLDTQMNVLYYRIQNEKIEQKI